MYRLTLLGATLLGAWLATVGASAQSPVSSGTVITIAGNGLSGFSGDGGPATNATMSNPSGLAIGPDGTLHFADSSNFRIRAIAPGNGVITTLAGNGPPPGGLCDGYGPGDGGPATNASFCSVFAVAVDRARHALYFADVDNNRVRKVNLTNGIISNYAGTGLAGFGYSGDGGPAVSAQVAFPQGVATDGTGRLFIADTANNRIRQVHPVTGLITTLAGNGAAVSAGDGGPATNASFAALSRVAADGAGNVFVVDATGTTNFIRRVDGLTGLISRIAGGGTNLPGSGPATNMTLEQVRDLAVDNTGTLYIANPTQVFKVDLATGQLTPFAGGTNASYGGDGGPALDAQFFDINGLSVPPGGGLVISDGNLRLRYVAPASVNLSGDNQQTAFYLPWVSALSGDFLVVGNTSLTNVSAGSLTNVGGSVSIDGNTSATGIDLGSLNTVGGSVSIDGNTSATGVSLDSLEFVGGSVSIDDNTSATGISLDLLDTVGGSVSIDGNTSATGIDLGSLSSVGGDVTIESNAPNATVNLSSLQSFGCGTNPAVLTLGAGTVLITNGLTLCTNATLTGHTTLDGSVTNRGEISPGSSPGRLDITGHLVLDHTSVLRLDLGGYAPGQSDFIAVAGSVALGGTLSLSFVNQFVGALTNGASFTLLAAGSPLTGAFANVPSGGTLATADGYVRFTVRYAGEMAVRLTDAVLVDTDNDGLPDWWEDRFGLSKTNAADAALDFDSDGASNVNEFLAGTLPDNPASLFRVVSLERAGESLRLIWTTVGGKSYRVQTDGSLDGPFGDFSPVIAVPGIGESTTNILDSTVVTNGAGRYYRVRLGP